MRYLYQAQRGADILVAADDEGVVEAIDERTLLVPVTHVLYKTGEIQDVEAIVASGARGGRAAWCSTPTSRPARCRST